MKTEAVQELEDEERKSTFKFPVDLLDEFRHLAIDRKTTVTSLIIEAMKQYLKAIKR